MYYNKITKKKGSIVKMEEKDELLEEMRKQNRYLKSQLTYIRIGVAVMLLVIVGIGVALSMAYPKIQEISQSVSELEKKADETMTGIQNMSNHADQVIQQAGEILENLKPASEEIEKIDMETLVKNLNTLSENIALLDLEKFQTLIKDLQEAVSTAVKFAGLIK